MARPQRLNVDYFPHYISDGKKMFYIEQKYGNDGYASWFKILETLARTDNHFVNLNEHTESMFMAAKCRISEETLFNILDDLAKLDQINAELWELKIIWSDKFIESIHDSYSKRLNNCPTYEGLRSTLSTLGILKVDGNTQSKVKETKEEERKEEKRTDKLPPDFETFKAYALENKSNIDLDALKLKYNSWIENGWKTNGKAPKKIVNWKSTLLNTLTYIKEKETKLTFDTNR